MCYSQNFFDEYSIKIDKSKKTFHFTDRIWLRQVWNNKNVVFSYFYIVNF